MGKVVATAAMMVSIFVTAFPIVLMTGTYQEVRFFFSSQQLRLEEKETKREVHLLAPEAPVEARKGRSDEPQEAEGILPTGKRRAPRSVTFVSGEENVSGPSVAEELVVNPLSPPPAVRMGGDSGCCMVPVNPEARSHPELVAVAGLTTFMGVSMRRIYSTAAGGNKIYYEPLLTVGPLSAAQSPSVSLSSSQQGEWRPWRASGQSLADDRRSSGSVAFCFFFTVLFSDPYAKELVLEELQRVTRCAAANTSQLCFDVAAISESCVEVLPVTSFAVEVFHLPPRCLLLDSGGMNPSERVECTIAADGPAAAAQLLELLPVLTIQIRATTLQGVVEVTTQLQQL
jgi:hypothetical protein